jgi:5-carboxymethyl-2-hydroxymuconate isomerase
MAHLIIQYSANLHDRFDRQALCNLLHERMVSSKIFPVGGIRVRTVRVDDYAIADLHPDNAFVDMVLRMGAGRTIEQKKMFGESVVSDSKAFFDSELSKPHFALSLEILEIESELSWKVNSIHARLKQHG